MLVHQAPQSIANKTSTQNWFSGGEDSNIQTLGVSHHAILVDSADNLDDIWGSRRCKLTPSSVLCLHADELGGHEA